MDPLLAQFLLPADVTSIPLTESMENGEAPRRIVSSGSPPFNNGAGAAPPQLTGALGSLFLSLEVPGVGKGEDGGAAVRI